MTIYSLVGWWRDRGFRISHREGNSILGYEGTLLDLFPFPVPLFFLYVLLSSLINILILKLNLLSPNGSWE